jgi:hypothetical protein
VVAVSLYLAFLWICYGVAGWSRGNLLISVCTASAMSAAMYLVLTTLSQFLPRIGGLAIGVAISLGITSAAMMKIRRDLA